jgi:hypothetical protein
MLRLVTLHRTQKEARRAQPTRTPTHLNSTMSRFPAQCLPILVVSSSSGHKATYEDDSEETEKDLGDGWRYGSNAADDGET